MKLFSSEREVDEARITTLMYLIDKHACLVHSFVLSEHACLLGTSEYAVLSSVVMTAYIS